VREGPPSGDSEAATAPSSPLSRATEPLSHSPPHVALLRFGRSRTGRPVLIAGAVLMEAGLLAIAAQHADTGNFRGVPGVSSVVVACALAALCGPLAGGLVAFLASVVFVVAVAEGVFGSWLVLALWPLVAVGSGVLTDRLLAAEAERTTLVARLVESERGRVAAQIVGGIGHHFHNLLTVIMGNAELARLGLDDAKDARTVAALEALERAGERLHAITRLLLIIGGDTSSPRGTRDASASVRAIRDQLADVAAPRRLELQITDEPCPVHVEDGALELLLFELVRNAAEASPPDRGIRVATSRTASEVVLEVADSGRGMSRHEIQQAFEPFFSTKPPAASTGLGLPVARAITDAAGGRLHVVSHPGRGTTVRAQLPLAEAASEEPRRSHGLPEPVQ
jgi:signal transduction histidine kinase